MLFNSLEFIFLFLPIFVFVYFYLYSRSLIILSRSWILIASILFYGYWKIEYVPLILGSIVFNFLMGNFMRTCQEESGWFGRKAVLYFSSTVNLILLAYFKYCDFFIEEINKFHEGAIDPLNLILPIGISFYTFSQITYLVDTYRGEVKSSDLLSYAVFVIFFPALLAGPVLRYHEFIPQLDQLKQKIFNYINFQKGCFLFSIGLVKRVILSDTFSLWANQGFENVGNLDFLSAWIASLSYTLQIYFDFSGYTDMALGAALMININLPKNFNSPYKAHNIQEFWRRWHMTLFRFLRDYIYFPLGGNKDGIAKNMRNIFVVFLIAGVWHGAGWTYILWGMLNGIALVLYQFWKKLGIQISSTLAIFITFNFVNASWVVFRANNLSEAISFLATMVNVKTLVLPEKLISLHEILKPLEFMVGEHPVQYSHAVLCVPFGLILLIFKNSDELIDSNIYKSKIAIGIYYALLVYCLLLVAAPSDFIYFDF